MGLMANIKSKLKEISENRNEKRAIEQAKTSKNLNDVYRVEQRVDSRDKSRKYVTIARLPYEWDKSDESETCQYCNSLKEVEAILPECKFTKGHFGKFDGVGHVGVYTNCSEELLQYGGDIKSIMLMNKYADASLSEIVPKYNDKVINVADQRRNSGSVYKVHLSSEVMNYDVNIIRQLWRCPADCDRSDAGYTRMFADDICNYYFDSLNDAIAYMSNPTEEWIKDADTDSRILTNMDINKLMKNEQFAKLVDRFGCENYQMRQTVPSKAERRAKEIEIEASGKAKLSHDYGLT